MIYALISFAALCQAQEPTTGADAYSTPDGAYPTPDDAVAYPTPDAKDLEPEAVPHKEMPKPDSYEPDVGTDDMEMPKPDSYEPDVGTDDMEMPKPDSYEPDVGTDACEGSLKDELDQRVPKLQNCLHQNGGDGTNCQPENETECDKCFGDLLVCGMGCGDTNWGILNPDVTTPHSDCFEGCMTTFFQCSGYEKQGLSDIKAMFKKGDDDSYTVPEAGSNGYATPDAKGKEDPALLEAKPEEKGYPIPGLATEDKAPMPEVRMPMEDYVLDAINKPDWESIDLKNHEADQYERFFVIEGAHRCPKQDGGLPRSTIVKLDDQPFEKGNCHHICAAQVDLLELCYGYSENESGDCEFYHEPLADFGSGPNDEEFTGQGCYKKGVDCGGHHAVDCKHCPTPHSEHPETECNGQCIYTYENKVEDRKVVGECRARTEEETDESLKSCGAHMANTCEDCVERFTYNCEEGYRYCNGDCNWEKGECGVCPTTTSTTTTTTGVPTTTTTTTTEAPKKDGTGDYNQSQGFDATLLR